MEPTATGWVVCSMEILCVLPTVPARVCVCVCTAKLQCCVLQRGGVLINTAMTKASPAVKTAYRYGLITFPIRPVSNTSNMFKY